MFRTLKILSVATAVLLGASHAFAQTSLDTRFTYQGKLSLLGEPVNDTADFEFRLFNDDVPGVEVGSAVVANNLDVVDGVFKVELDFGNVFGETALFLEVSVRSPHDPDNMMLFTTLLPRQRINVVPVALALRHMRTEATTDAPNIIGGDATNAIGDANYAATIVGGAGNQLFANHGFIGGGGGNRIYDNYCVISGGGANIAGLDDGEPSIQWYSTIGGGYANTAGGTVSTVAGGQENIADGWVATVSGGGSNTAGADRSTVGGGAHNDARGDDSTIGGGFGNFTEDLYSTVGGGLFNRAEAAYATIAGGGPWSPFDLENGNNRIFDNYGSIGGGGGNRAGSDDSDSGTAAFAVVGGGSRNSAGGTCSTVSGGWLNSADADYATIAGGGPSDQGDILNTNNRVFDDYGTIGGGGDNRSGTDDSDTTNAAYVTIAGGRGNIAQAEYGTIGGGDNNAMNGPYSVITGGRDNAILSAPDGAHNSIGGGKSNNIVFARNATIAGGGAYTDDSDPQSPVSYNANIVYDNAGTVGGGSGNTAGSLSGSAFSQQFATVAGGANNTASGVASTIPGGVNNTASGDYSFAAGQNSTASGNNTFAWCDGSAALNATTSNRFVALSTSGFKFITTPDLNTGVQVPAGGGSWLTFSDRNAKRAFEFVDPQNILERVCELPLSEWTYKSQGTVRHIGPMAQDFHEAFGLGVDDRHIATVDADGVALAAIQGLNQRLEAQNAEIQCLRDAIDGINGTKDREIESLHARIACLESLVEEFTE
ncbi:MAG: hypothetical protein MI923_21300 [Phycisphaerales bacterium]|nr:hypothetical protein [Phycisphaerales bacterium]